MTEERGQGPSGPPKARERGTGPERPAEGKGAGDRRIEVGGVGLEVHVCGPDGGQPVVLLHGWPDRASLWDNQVAALTEAGFRTIAPDLRGFGDSDKPEDVDSYNNLFLAADVQGILDHLGIDRAFVVGHDWGRRWRGRSPGSRRTGSTSWWRCRSDTRAGSGAPAIPFPPVAAPTMGIWSTGDAYLTEAQMKGSGSFVSAPFRYERLEGASHWMQLDAPEEVNRLLLDFLR